MQTYPRPTDILTAVARFLDADVKTALSDSDEHRGLRFRVLIATHLLARLADEIAVDDVLVDSEHDALRHLLDAADDDIPRERPDRHSQTAQLDTVLAQQIRDGAFDDPPAAARLRTHLLATLGARLAVTSPRFDRAQTIE